MPEKVADDVPSDWAPGIDVGDLYGVPDSWYQPGQALDVAPPSGE